MIEISEWFLFIRKSIELIVCALMGILVINNFLVKLYIPGEYIYPSNPCSEPYMKPTSKDKFDRININKRVPQEQIALKRSQYDICEKMDEPRQLFEGRVEQKELLDFLKSITTDATSLDMVELYSVVRNKNRERAMVPSHHGVVDQLIWSIAIVYLTSNISVRRMFGSIHNTLGGLCMDKTPFVFYAAFIVFLIFTFYFSGSKPLAGPINAVVLMTTGILGLMTITLILYTLWNIVNMFIFCSATTTWLLLLLVMPFFIICFILAILQSAIMAIQHFIFFVLDPFFNTKLRTLSLCELQKYKKGIILILLMFTIVSATQYLSRENMGIVTFISILTAVYAMTRSNSNPSDVCSEAKKMLHKMNERCEDDNNNNNNNNNTNKNE